MITFKHEGIQFGADWPTTHNTTLHLGDFLDELPPGLISDEQDVWAAAAINEYGELSFAYFRKRKLVSMGSSIRDVMVWAKDLGAPAAPVFSINGQFARAVNALLLTKAKRLYRFLKDNDENAMPASDSSWCASTVRRGERERMKLRPVQEVAIAKIHSEAVERAVQEVTVATIDPEAVERACKAVATKLEEKANLQMGHHHVPDKPALTFEMTKSAIARHNAYAENAPKKKTFQAKTALTKMFGTRFVEAIEHDPDKAPLITAQALPTRDLVSELLRRSMHHPKVESFFDASMPWFQSVRIGDGAHVHAQQVVKGPDGKAWRVVDLAPDKIYACPCHRVAPPKAFNPKNLTSWT